MAIYTVHVPSWAGDPVERADRTVFVRDGFSRGAFLFGPLYFLRYRSYVAAAAWIVAVIAIGVVDHLLSLPLWADTLMALLVMLFTGLEASSIRRYALNRGGRPVEEVVRAPDLEAGEAAFFGAATARPAAVTPRRGAGLAAPTGVIGLFPEPGA